MANLDENPEKRGKEPKKTSQSPSVPIPSEIFKDRSLSVLEILVEYMKDKLGYSYHEIAVLLNRNDRTIWTVYSRAKKKRQGKQPEGSRQSKGQYEVEDNADDRS